MATPETIDSRKPAMLEFRLVLESAAAWNTWKSQHMTVLTAENRADAVATIARDGIVAHPFGNAVAASDLRIPTTAFGDIVHARETSDKRALLTAFLELTTSEPRFSRRRLKVLGKGLLPRHMLELRKRCPFCVDEGDDTARAMDFDIVLADLSDEKPQDIAKRIPMLACRLAAGGRLLAALPFDPATVKDERRTVGWSIIDSLTGSGLGAPRIRWYLSQTEGILGRRGIGVFLADGVRPASTEHSRPTSLSGLIGLLGVPRSGTTMLTGLLGAHSRVHSVYEPWNAQIGRYSSLLSKDDIRALGDRDPFDLAPDDFIGEFNVAVPAGKDWLLVKETTTRRPYIDAIEGLLCKAPQPLRHHLIWLVRDPFHVYVSEIEARRKWWGAGDIVHSRELFDRWSIRTLRSIIRLRELVQRFESTVVSYEHLVRSPRETMAKLMARLQIPFEETQLDYHKTIRKQSVKGDNTVATNPREVSAESTVARQREFEPLRRSISDMAVYELIDQLARWTRGLADRAVITGGDAYLGRLDPLLQRVPKRKRRIVETL